MLGDTRLRTPTGAVPVEQLRAGDLVLTHTGAAQPVLRVQSRPYSGRITQIGVAAPPRGAQPAVTVTETQPVMVDDPAYRRHPCYVYPDEAAEREIFGVEIGVEPEAEEVSMLEMWGIEVKKDHSVLTECGIVLHAGG